jgi:hypothetical protein
VRGFKDCAHVGYLREVKTGRHHTISITVEPPLDTINIRKQEHGSGIKMVVFDLTSATSEWKSCR